MLQRAVITYESGQRRVLISLLPLLARTFGVTVENLIGVPAVRSAGKRGPASKIQQQLEHIEALPKAQQRFVMQTSDTVLQQQQASRLTKAPHAAGLCCFESARIALCFIRATLANPSA